MRPLSLCFAAIALLLAACEPDPQNPAPAPVAAVPVADSVAGDAEAVYVPVYSHIFFRDSTRSVDLATTLSVRNTDPDAPIQVDAVRYYDSDGRLVREHIRRPVVLGPLASRNYVVEERDRTGGVGANFIVEWRGEGASPPVIEAVMISTASTQGISFVSRGVVIE